MTDDGHSALYLTDARDLWWNQDFLALIGARLKLHQASRVLDVGAGHGHWTRAIAPLVAPGADVVGVERDPRWVERASAGPSVAGRGVRFIQGAAEALAFQDNVFDVVTCQTLLIHVKEPRAVVQEMLRVLAPGGVLLLVEPNNLANLANLVSRPDFDLDDLLAQFRLQAICEKGKHALGLGYNSLGEGLIELVDPAQVRDVAVWNNDRCTVFHPGMPGAGRVELTDERRLVDGDAVCWPRAETRRYFLAGGGVERDFEALWQRARAAVLHRLEAREQGALATNAGGLFYLLGARKR
jgi:SAM-dependent methyltransferase